MKPAARITDSVAHPIPPVLTGGPPAFTVLIGNLPAWLALNPIAGAALQASQTATYASLVAVQATATAAAGTPAAPAAIAAAETAKSAALAAMGATIGAMASAGASIHACVTPWPVPPHGPGVAIGSTMKVLIGPMKAPPACVGDTIVEAIGPPNAIVTGCWTVLVG